MTKSGEIARGFHASWAEVDDSPQAWRWPHFTPKELSCKCGGRNCRGEYFHDPEILDRLERLRAAMKAPLVVTSGRRCPGHNRRVGGAPRSQHMLAIAVDISLMGHDAKLMARAAIAAGFKGIGFGASFLHVDGRPTLTPFHYPNGRASWIKRFGWDPVARLKAGASL